MDTFPGIYTISNVSLSLNKSLIDKICFPNDYEYAKKHAKLIILWNMYFTHLAILILEVDVVSYCKIFSNILKSNNELSNHKFGPNFHS